MDLSGTKEPRSETKTVKNESVSAPSPAAKIAFLSGLLGHRIWRKVLGQLSARELARLNRYGQSRAGNSQSQLPGARERFFLLRQLSAYLDYRSRERRRLERLVGLDSLFIALFLLGTLFVFLLMGFSTALQRQEIGRELRLILEAGLPVIFVWSLVSLYLRREWGESFSSLLLPARIRLGLAREGVPRYLGKALLAGSFGGIILFVLLGILNINHQPGLTLPTLLLVLHLSVGLVFAPLLEETVFRRLLGDYFARELGIIPAALITSLLFALAHNPVSVPDSILYAASGFLLFLLYRQSQGLLAPVLAHGIANTMIILL